MMKFFLLGVFALVLQAPTHWAARPSLKSPVKDLSSPFSAALKVPAHPVASQKQLTLGKGVMTEEVPRSAAKVESTTGGKELPQKSREFSILKNSLLRKKKPIHHPQDDQTLRKIDIAQEEVEEAIRDGRKVLGTKKIEANSSYAKPEAAWLEINSSSIQAINRHKKKGSILTTKAPVQGIMATQTMKTRKENTVGSRTVAKTGRGKALGPGHRNESWTLSIPGYKHVIQTKEGNKPRFLHRNASWVLLQKKNRPPHRNTGRLPAGKHLGIFQKNSNCTLMGKKCIILTRSITQAPEEREAGLLSKDVSLPPKGKQFGMPSTNICSTFLGPTQGTFKKNVSQAQAYKSPSVIHRNASQPEPAKNLVTPPSQVQPRRNSMASLRSASQTVLQEKLSLFLRNTSRASPGKGLSTQQGNISWAEANKELRPSHRNASWALPKKESRLFHRNVSQARTGNKRGIQNRNNVARAQPGDISACPFQTTIRPETRQEECLLQNSLFRGRASTSRWQPAKAKEKNEPIMPSLPSTCLLSEHAIACGNAHLKHVPRLSDSALKTFYLAENEITNIPAEIFLGLPNLEWLDLSKNKLDSVGLHPDAFKNLTKLKRLNLEGNQLTSIPTLPSSLHELKLNDNNLEGLQRQNFRGLFKMLTLELEGNQLHDGSVAPITFKALGRLIYLRLGRNLFRTIPSGLPASLQELHLDSNRIEEVTEGTLNKTLSLTMLVLSNNQLEEDRIAPQAWIDLPKLETLDLSHNHLAHVPSFLPRHLKQLSLHHNHIERIPGYVFAHMKPGLEFLHLSHNMLRDDGIHAVSFLGLYHSLAELLLDNNWFEAIPQGIVNLKGLQVLRLSHNRIRHIPLNSICDTRVAEDSSIVSVHLENNLIDRHLIPPTAFSCIRAYHSVILRPQQNEDEY